LKCWVHLTSPIGLIELQGVLRLDTVSQLRDAVWKVMAEQPDAIVLDLAELQDTDDLCTSVFPALGRAVAGGVDGELILAAPEAGVRRAMRRSAPLFVRMFGTLSQAMEEAARAPAHRQVTSQLPADLSAARSARHLVDEVCARWQLAHLRETATMIANELATNAVEHGSAPVELCVTVRRRVLRIEVSDASDVMPDRFRTSRHGVMHYGLQLVEALADRWGAIPAGRGKTVWADLVLHPRRGP
jgi:anti-sigma regulatory factor (Ser/Thr protein kinase)